MNRKGFTLVEGIVVSAIVAVLAVAAIVLYNGYVQNSAQQSVNQMAETVATTANSYVRRFNPASNIDITPNLLRVTVPKGYRISINKNSRQVQVYDSVRNIQSETVNY